MTLILRPFTPTLIVDVRQIHIGSRDDSLSPGAQGSCKRNARSDLNFIVGNALPFGERIDQRRLRPARMIHAEKAPPSALPTTNANCSSISSNRFIIVVCHNQRIIAVFVLVFFSSLFSYPASRNRSRNRTDAPTFFLNPRFWAASSEEAALSVEPVESAAEVVPVVGEPEAGRAGPSRRLAPRSLADRRQLVPVRNRQPLTGWLYKPEPLSKEKKSGA